MKRAISLVLVLVLGLAFMNLTVKDTWTTKANMLTARSLLRSFCCSKSSQAKGGDEIMPKS
jgi:hypothetical protein